jgi:hypothetical protein
MPDEIIISDSETILANLEEVASGPEQVTTDAGSVRQHSLADLIAAHKYSRAIGATAGRNPALALRFARLVPGGTVQRDRYPCR